MAESVHTRDCAIRHQSTKVKKTNESIKKLIWALMHSGKRRRSDMMTNSLLESDLLSPLNITHIGMPSSEYTNVIARHITSYVDLCMQLDYQNGPLEGR